jgi:NADPH-dependent curcumin reductase CurA
VRDIRREIWRHLASDWKPAHLATIHTGNTTLDGVPDVFAQMLAGASFGRTVVDINAPHV